MKGKKLNGAQIFVESLKAEEVEVIFGYTGAKVINIYDQLYGSDIRQIMPHHEQGGIHAADGYARSTGKVGVCLTTSGPGATNLITGLATAYMDSVPLVAFTGQVNSWKLGTDAFQETDITGISMPVTKHNYLVDDISKLAETIKEAFYIAQNGRPGPVLIDITADVLTDEAEFSYPKDTDIVGYKTSNKDNMDEIKKAADLINNAEKPVIYAGGGTIISGADYILRELTEKAAIPVTTTLMGIGIFPRKDKLSLGMLGMHGTTEANLAVTNSDLIIALGARFDDRVTGKLETFAPGADIIHVDIDSAEIGKLIEVDVAIVGDVKQTLMKLLPLIKERKLSRWNNKIKKWRELDTIKGKSHTEDMKNSQDSGKNHTDKINPGMVIEELDKLIEGNAIITTEVGQHQMWAAQYFRSIKPRSFISSGGLGTMGYGFPAAVGAQVGNPDETVICIAGDGSLQMNIQELATIAKNKIPVKIIILNNQYLGMVRQWQELFYDKRYSQTCMRKQEGCPAQCSGPNKNCPEMVPNFIKVADGYGIKGKRVDASEDVRPALKEALTGSGPYILDFIIGEEENVFPMVPAGGGLDDMLLDEH
ncbi:MAG: biosynthetic-type acetolactate synthase large subunit [Halothermotrichaceae bacterium]